MEFFISAIYFPTEIVIDIFTYYFQYWQTEFYLYFKICVSLRRNIYYYFFATLKFKDVNMFQDLVKIWSLIALFVFYLVFYALRTSLSRRYDGFVSKKTWYFGSSSVCGSWKLCVCKWIRVNKQWWNSVSSIFCTYMLFS